jgi:hypothetical protein
MELETVKIVSQMIFSPLKSVHGHRHRHRIQPVLDFEVENLLINLMDPRRSESLNTKLVNSFINDRFSDHLVNMNATISKLLCYHLLLEWKWLILIFTLHRLSSFFFLPTF